MRSWLFLIAEAVSAYLARIVQIYFYSDLHLLQENTVSLTTTPILTHPGPSFPTFGLLYRVPEADVEGQEKATQISCSAGGLMNR